MLNNVKLVTHPPNLPAGRQGRTSFLQKGPKDSFAILESPLKRTTHVYPHSCGSFTKALR